MIISFLVLESRSLKLSYWQACAPFWRFWKRIFLPSFLAILNCPWIIATTIFCNHHLLSACRCMSLCVFSLHCFSIFYFVWCVCGHIGGQKTTSSFRSCTYLRQVLFCSLPLLKLDQSAHEFSKILLSLPLACLAAILVFMWVSEAWIACMLVW